MNFTEFSQKSPVAWEISREILLNCAEGPLKFLGIQILTKKIKSEFATLPADAQNSLKELIFSQVPLKNSLKNPLKTLKN